ncbi:hypothetical protein Micbo1qcDRAFT_233953 [Microdochium bolleyi]|uniref:DUF7053 domain-containing protein n=1 Tax=Microdochium bolleyi TaxID=196109 RepID=A0A136J2S1_9PEZI|nr:hypothetical protein Micbo1qcDRAFT_233953 [Microdochium bolleyi]
MSWLSAKQNMTNTSTLPEGATREQALAVLHDHDFMIKCDPHYVKHSREAQPSASTATDYAQAAQAFTLPDLASIGKPTGGQSEADPYVNVYMLTDDLPNPFFSSTINSRLEYLNLESGLWTRVSSPMGVVLETAWIIRDAESSGGDGGDLELHQEIVITANKMLMGTVRGKIEANRGGIHKLFRARLEKDMAGGATEPTPTADAPAPAAADTGATTTKGAA